MCGEGSLADLRGSRPRPARRSGPQRPSAPGDAEAVRPAHDMPSFASLVVARSHDEARCCFVATRRRSGRGLAARCVMPPWLAGRALGRRTG
jgi:hypothetical protein